MQRRNPHPACAWVGTGHLRRQSVGNPKVFKFHLDSITPCTELQRARAHTFTTSATEEPFASPLRRLRSTGPGARAGAPDFGSSPRCEQRRLGTPRSLCFLGPLIYRTSWHSKRFGRFMAQDMRICEKRFSGGLAIRGFPACVDCSPGWIRHPPRVE